MKLWHNLIMERIPNEYMTRMRHSSVNAFCKVWDPHLVHIGPTLLSSILQGYLNLDSLSLHLCCFKNIPPVTLSFVTCWEARKVGEGTVIFM